MCLLNVSLDVWSPMSPQCGALGGELFEELQHNNHLAGQIFLSVLKELNIVNFLAHFFWIAYT